MKNRHLFRPISGLALALVVLGAGMAPAQATVLTTNFSSYVGLGYGVGTNQTMVQNGIQLDCLQGMYEVTSFPEVNLKDFAGTSAVRQIQLKLQSGQNFDFVGFSVRDLWSNLLTITSDQGGSFVVPSGFTSYPFSGPGWENLTWVRFTYTGRYTEGKFTSFSLVPRDGTVGVAPSSWSAVKHLFE